MTLEQIEEVARRLDAYNADDAFLPPADAQFAAKALRKLSEFAHRIEGIPQTNPTEEDARVVRNFAKTARKAKHKDEQTWKNMIKGIEQARDKFIQQEFKNLANKLLKILDQVPKN